MSNNNTVHSSQKVTNINVPHRSKCRGGGVKLRRALHSRQCCILRFYNSGERERTPGEPGGEDQACPRTAAGVRYCTFYDSAEQRGSANRRHQCVHSEKEKKNQFPVMSASSNQPIKVKHFSVYVTDPYLNLIVELKLTILTIENTINFNQRLFSFYCGVFEGA